MKPKRTESTLTEKTSALSIIDHTRRTDDDLDVRVPRSPPRGRRSEGDQARRGFQGWTRRDPRGRARGCARAAAARPTGRRSFSVATLAAVVAAASTPNAALAFGSGIPGYDINQKARDAQRKAINDELAEQRELARKEKERRKAAKGAGGGGGVCEKS